MEENILASVKEMIGAEDDYDHFNKPLILCLNSVFGVLFQLGVGPKDRPFVMVDGSETWDQFLIGDQIETVKNYIAIRVQLAFDPPTSSFVLNYMNDMAKEYEWRLNVDAETP